MIFGVIFLFLLYIDEKMMENYISCLQGEDGMMRKNKGLLCLLGVLCCILLFNGCARKQLLDPSKPVTITMWHNFGGQMQTTMDDLISEFNATVGKENGIILSVTSISSSATLQEKLLAAANGDPGSPTLPNLVTCYPKIALQLANKGLLTELDSQFSDAELARYLPRFIEEGRLEDGSLYVFPIAKSTEVLFVDRTLFDRFSSATGADFDALKDFERLSMVSRRYYEWTDSHTPDIPGDGKSFFTTDSVFNYFQVGLKQLGIEPITGERLACDVPEFRRIWDSVYEPAVRGGYAVFDGYSSDLSKLGELVCSTGSTAGILFYGSQIIYPDNTTEDVTYTILPYPTFQGGGSISIQRGSGMCVMKATPAQEYASALFLKWFTEPKQNMRFVSSTGYLPVTNEAFTNSMAQEIQQVEDENIKKLLQAAITMHSEYDFYIPPTFESFDMLGKSIDKSFKSMARAAREKYLLLVGEMSPDEAYALASKGDFEAFVSQYR